jgi:4-hydroxy-tetrahydrodipicolinate reductase
MIRVAVLGALGNMGREVIRAVQSDPGLELAAAVDPLAAGEFEGCGFEVEGDIECLEGRNIDVAVDFTHAAAAIPNIMWSLDNGIHSVVGTTGIPPEKLSQIAKKAESGKANVIIAANFALGAVLMMKFAEVAAGVFDQCEIVELHHRGKKDSPSGTAVMTAARIADAMDAAVVPGAVESTVKGARGGTLGAVNIHSVRLDGLVAHQEVIFGSPGQTLTIRHDTTDRTCFMPGVLMAVKAIGDLPGLTIGLEPVLDI